MALHRLETLDVAGADVVCVHEHGGDAGQEHLVEDEQADDHPDYRVDPLTGVVRYDIAKPTREWNLMSIRCKEILLFGANTAHVRNMCVNKMYVIRECALTHVSVH